MTSGYNEGLPAAISFLHFDLLSATLRCSRYCTDNGQQDRSSLVAYCLLTVEDPAKPRTLMTNGLPALLERRRQAFRDKGAYARAEKKVASPESEVGPLLTLPTESKMTRDVLGIRPSLLKVQGA